MEGSICSANAESVEGNKPDLSIVDGVDRSEEGTIVGALEETTASVDPNVLVVSLGIDQGGELLRCLGLSEVLLVIEVNV